VIPLAGANDVSAWVERSLGYVFVQPELCWSALTHRSAGGRHNERLEFLGDSILNCVVARLLYDADPAADEGTLSRRRATLVNEETLARIAGETGFGERLRLGPGELKSGGFRRASILADSLEAMLGAIFLDSGYAAAAAVIARLIGPRLSGLPAVGQLKDPKTRLQEALQARGFALPVYTLTAVHGEAHAQSFTVHCEVAALQVATVGEGGTRRRAEQVAAERLLALLPPDLSCIA
jgi:ribonuclease-3